MQRTFSSEFKQEAASLVLDHNFTIRQASKTMNVSLSSIRRWVKQTRIIRERNEYPPMAPHSLASILHKSKKQNRFILMLVKKFINSIFRAKN